MFGIKKEKNQGLNIMIIGCGKVGRTIVEQLCLEGHDITVIDKNPAKVEAMANIHDVMGVCGNGASFSVQKEAGIQDTDLVIAVTGSDELNLLCCTVAKQVTDCSAIARVRTPDYNDDISYLREKLGLARIINPELEAAKEVARILYLPAALEVSSFAHGQAEIVKFKIPAGNVLDKLKIMDLNKRLKHNVLICAVERNEEITIPSGTFELRAGDIVSFLGTRKNCARFFKSIGFDTHRVDETMIVGGGKAAYYLADQLLRAGISVKIIESNYKRCEELSTLLPEAVIINGDGTDETLLREEGLATVESFVPLTGIDEENIMLALHAKQVSTAKVITKVNRTTFKSVMANLDLGSVIYPKYITSETIISYVRAKQASKDSNVEVLYHMFDSKAEAVEFVVTEESLLTNKTLLELQLKNNLLVSFISRKGRIFIPTGQDTIQVGDEVMIVTTHTGFQDITDILA